MRFVSFLSILILLFLPAACFGAKPLSDAVQDSVRDYTRDLPVFPGAEGFGSNTPAGRGGKVIRVTSLAASGPGSLREALESPEPRTIVFETAGIIDLREMLRITHPFVTVAGETAPAPGVTIIGAGLGIHTHDVLVRHLRFRVGGREDGPAPEGRDGIGITGDEDVYNVIIDHCSVSWAVDEGCSTWGAGVRDVTLSNCIIAENLSRSIHPKKEHSKGFLIGDHTKRIASLRNLYASNMRRSPFVKGDVSALIVNNLIYNPGSAAIHFGDLENSGPSMGTVIGNVMIPGPDTAWNLPLVRLLVDMDTNSRIFAMGNESGERSEMKTWRGKSAWRNISAYEEAGVRVKPLTILPADQVKEHVLEHAGARPAQRDAADIRVVKGIRGKTGRIIDSEEEAGGFPVSAPVGRPLELPENPEADDDGDGYTNLEEWLHGLADELETQGSA
jgi:pectate lyase